MKPIFARHFEIYCTNFLLTTEFVVDTSCIGSSNSGGSGKVVEVDDFVIIPSGTPFQEVVSTVLTLLGYPKETIQQAVGKPRVVFLCKL